MRVPRRTGVPITATAMLLAGLMTVPAASAELLAETTDQSARQSDYLSDSVESQTTKPAKAIGHGWVASG